MLDADDADLLDLAREVAWERRRFHDLMAHPDTRDPDHPIGYDDEDDEA